MPINPLLWERRHQIALLVAGAIGAALGVVLGYIVYGAARGAEGGTSFSRWLSSPLWYGGLWWAVFGAIVAGGAVYIRRLISN
jgi:hypothetical protein